MLSVVSKIYDPLGFATPFLLKGKRILQVLCKSNYSWDKVVSDDYIKDWNKWKRQLQLLEELKINRRFKPSKFGKVIDCSLHHFSDASQNGYEQVSYLRPVDQKGMIHCGLVMTKLRVTPIEFVSIPRLELAIAALSIKVSMMLRKELTIHSKIKEYFWTDSQVVLSYINSNSKRFNLFVANRVQLIKENSDVSQWMYIESKFNPADDSSRGLSASNQEKVKRWVRGPEFLWKGESSWVNQED